MTAVGPKRKFFDAWSRVYDAPWVQRATYRPVHDAVIDALRGAAPQRLLDIGCGTGQLARRMADTFAPARVVGCDFSPGMLGRAGRRSSAVRWVCADAARLPFVAGAVDVLVCTEAFHWFPDQAAALAEFHRVIAPGGRLLLAAVNPPAASLSQAFWIGSRLVGEPFYWPTKRQMREWIERAGFRVERQRRIFRLPGFLLPPVLTSAVRATQRARR